ncbi:MAG: hypothetical protein K2X27_23550 [Candidatus Obscuribacterales bacterium]|nr:hypothetical protein [Candidatus Obscuribacterales bacterium]
MDFDLNRVFWLFIWYLVAGGFIAFFIFVFRFLNMPRWRDDHGDRTSEVGYFEDPVGRVLDSPFYDEPETDAGDAPPPHIQGSSNMNSGLG